MSSRPTYTIPSFSKKWRLLYFVALLLAFCCSKANAQAISREYKLKAVFLYNFSSFVEWPPSAFNSADAPFVIGIVGPDPFGSFLDETVAGEKAQGHPMVVKRFDDVREVKDCQILFINQPGHTADVLSSIKNRNILTVSDENNFARMGGMIHFSTESNKIRLQINPSAAKAEKLNISSKLLRLAKIIGN